MDIHSELKDIFGKLGLKIIEKLFEQTLDYKQLVDSHFRYLYNPKVEWAKFTKMVLFLETVRTYIKNQMQKAKNINNGYYHDLLKVKNNIDISGIGTTNYTNLINSIIDGVNPAYLNGSIDDFYDPYLNKIIKFNSEQERLQHPHITVPLIFTQSGIKPLTSIEMSRRYVNLYDQFCQSNAIVVVGYGFNDDDGHINGFFRDLIQDKEKELFIIRRQNDKSKEDIKKECASQLRIDLTLTDKLNIILVDNNRKEEDILWCDKVTKILFEKQNKSS
ncbi:SIR2 family protein [Myxosarcina sp. GI1(2024)]